MRGKSATSLAAGLALLLPARADAQIAEAGVRLGWAGYAGSIERGTKASDLAYGSVPLAIDAVARFGPRVGLGAGFEYALTVPKLCESASDCVSSLGRDVGLVLLGRFDVVRAGRFRGEAEVGAGYVWSSRGISSKGAESTRTYEGPRLLQTSLLPSLRLGPRSVLGLVLSVRLDATRLTGLEAPGVRREGRPEGDALRGVWMVGMRMSWGFGAPREEARQ